MATDTAAASALDPSELRRQKILARSGERLAALTGMRRSKVPDVPASEPVPVQLDQPAPSASSRPLEDPPATPVPPAVSPGVCARPPVPSGTATAHRWAAYASSSSSPEPRPTTPALELATCLRAALRLTALPRLALAVWWAWAGVCGAGAPGPWYALAATVGALMLATTLALQASFPKIVQQLVRAIECMERLGIGYHVPLSIAQKAAQFGVDAGESGALSSHMVLAALLI